MLRGLLTKEERCEIYGSLTIPQLELVELLLLFFEEFDHCRKSGGTLQIFDSKQHYVPQNSMLIA